jgi:hypothetical protein
MFVSWVSGAFPTIRILPQASGLDPHYPKGPNGSCTRVHPGEQGFESLTAHK